MVYKWYILPIGGLYGTYHLLREPGKLHWTLPPSWSDASFGKLSWVCKARFFDGFCCSSPTTNPQKIMLTSIPYENALTWTHLIKSSLVFRIFLCFFRHFGCIEIFFTAPKIKIELWNDGLEDVFSFSRGPVFSGSSRSSSSVYPNLVPNPWPGICAMHIPLFSRDGFGRFWGLQNVNFPISSPVFGAVGVVGGFATATNCDFFGRKSGGFRKVDCVFCPELSFWHTVDGRNPAPPGMYKTLSILG